MARRVVRLGKIDRIQTNAFAGETRVEYLATALCKACDSHGALRFQPYEAKSHAGQKASSPEALTFILFPVMILWIFLCLVQIPAASGNIPIDFQNKHVRTHNIFYGWPNPHEYDEIYYIDRKVYYECKLGWKRRPEIERLLKCMEEKTCPNITDYIGGNAGFKRIPDYGDMQRIDYFLEQLPILKTAPGIASLPMMFAHVFFLIIPVPIYRLYWWMWKDLKHYIWKSYYSQKYYYADYTRGVRYARAWFNKFYLWDKRTGRIVGGHGWVDYVDELRAVKYGIAGVQLDPFRVLQPWILDGCKKEKKWLKIKEKLKPKDKRKKKRKHVRLRPSRLLQIQ